MGDLQRTGLIEGECVCVFVFEYLHNRKILFLFHANCLLIASSAVLDEFTAHSPPARQRDSSRQQ